MQIDFASKWRPSCGGKGTYSRRDTSAIHSIGLVAKQALSSFYHSTVNK